MLKFTKMVATGNDFIVVDNRRSIVRARAEFARRYCGRHFGIGADGVIFIESVKVSKYQSIRVKNIQHPEFKMRIFNPDGSEAEMCGNGARCAAVFARRAGIAKNKNFSFQTLAGRIEASVAGQGARIGMEEPSGIELGKRITAGNRKIIVHYINTGVPHAIIIFGSGIDRLDLREIAPSIRYNRAFPRGANVDFVQVLGRHRIKMRTYERGVEGETLACGTGAVASAVVSSLLGRVTSPVEVAVKGGLLKIYFKRVNVSACQRVNDVYLEGEARIVYKGVI
jgi:diaminopimelate epimerase